MCDVEKGRREGSEGLGRSAGSSGASTWGRRCRGVGLGIGLMAAIFGFAHPYDADGVEQDREYDQGGSEGTISRFHQTLRMKIAGAGVSALSRRAAVDGSIMLEAFLKVDGMARITNEI